MTSRPDPYTPVHKMQRARLFRLTISAGTTDPSDDDARRAVCGAVRAVIDEITAHGHHEERFVHPLLALHAPEIAADLERAHRELDERMAALASSSLDYAGAPPADANDLHRSISAFTSAYLAHLDVEERTALPVLWARLSDEDLGAVLSEFRATRSDLTNLASVLAMAPTLNPGERTQMLVGGPGAGPAPEVVDLLATVLEPRQLGALLAGSPG
jgi:hypothetical protein